MTEDSEIFTIDEIIDACSSYIKDNKEKIIDSQPEERKFLVISIIEKFF